MLIKGFDEQINDNIDYYKKLKNNKIELINN